jgi:HEAT repeat protein
MRARLFLSTLILCAIAGAGAGAQGPTPPADVSVRALQIALPPAPRAEQAADPADSLYKLARAALTDGDFRRAATLFQAVADRYPDSEYAPDALYYRAYALYRGGGSRELEQAVAALDRQALRYPKAGTLNDAKQLRASIRSEQAKRGNPDAGEEIAAGAKELGSTKRCPTDDDEMRMTALQGIVQLDPDQVLPVLQRLLARTDSCSVGLRRRAVYMIAQTREEERADILLRVASTDPSTEVRREAVRWLSQVNTERAARALDSILFNTSDADIRDKALYALSQHRSPVARQALRRFAEQSTVPTDLRVRAVYYIGNGRRSGDESDYLRGLFGKTASPELREAIVVAVANQKTPDRTAWLLGVARDRSQELEPRKRALFYAGQSGVELKELLPLYDEMAGQKELQDQMLLVYAQRREPEATDKLIQVARAEKVPELRKRAIFWLGQRKDPRAKQFLLEILNQ